MNWNRVKQGKLIPPRKLAMALLNADHIIMQYKVNYIEHILTNFKCKFCFNGIADIGEMSDEKFIF